MDQRSKAVVAGVILAATLACGVLSPASPPEAGVATIVAQTLTAAAITAPPETGTTPSPAGVEVTFPGGRLILPAGLAAGVTSETVAAALDAEGQPWWGIFPEHTRLTLQGYALQGKFHEPEILIFPAPEYAAVNESAAENISQIQGVISNPGGSIDAEALPNITFFNAGPVFHAQVAVVPFQAGSGIRTLTEYAQYAAPVSNNDMFYHFQGLTLDGAHYIVAILPITSPLMQADSAPSSVPPAGGVPFPDLGNPNPALYDDYYSAISNLRNSTPPDQFAPSLTDLDALLGSLSVAQ